MQPGPKHVIQAFDNLADEDTSIAATDAQDAYDDLKNNHSSFMEMFDRKNGGVIGASLMAALMGVWLACGRMKFMRRH